MKRTKLALIFVIALDVLFGGCHLINNMLKDIPNALDAQTISAQEWQDTISQWK